MKSKTRIGVRGAALVEYAMLLALIGVVSIPAVLGLGKKVDGTFDVVSGSLTDAQGVMLNPEVANRGEGPEDLPSEPGPVFSWKNDGTDALPPGVTKTAKGWYIDISSLVGSGVRLETARFDASISLAGTVEARYPGDPGWGSHLTVIGRSYWIQSDGHEYPLLGASDVVSPSGEALAHDAVTGWYVPSDVVGILLTQYFSCNLGSRCTEGAFNFDVDIYNLP